MAEPVGDALQAMARTIAIVELRQHVGEDLAINAVNAVAESVLRGPITVPMVLSLIAAAEAALDFQRDMTRHPEELADESWMRGNRVRASLGASEPPPPAPNPGEDDIAAVVAAWGSLAPMPVGVDPKRADLFRARRTLQAVDTDPRMTVRALADLAIRVAWARRGSG